MSTSGSARLSNATPCYGLISTLLYDATLATVGAVVLYHGWGYNQLTGAVPPAGTGLPTAFFLVPGVLAGAIWFFVGAARFVRPVRRDQRVGDRYLDRDRLNSLPGDDSTGLWQGVLGRRDRRGRHHRPDHPPFDSDDRIRIDHRRFDRCALCRRYRVGWSDRRCAVGRRVFHCKEARLTSAFAVVYAWFVEQFIYREFRWSAFPGMVRRAMLGSGMVMAIVGAATAVAWVLTCERVPQEVTEAMVSGIDSSAFFMIVSFGVLAGC